MVVVDGELWSLGIRCVFAETERERGDRMVLGLRLGPRERVVLWVPLRSIMDGSVDVVDVVVVGDPERSMIVEFFRCSYCARSHLKMIVG